MDWNTAEQVKERAKALINRSIPGQPDPTVERDLRITDPPLFYVEHTVRGEDYARLTQIILTEMCAGDPRLCTVRERLTTDESDKWLVKQFALGAEDACLEHIHDTIVYGESGTERIHDRDAEARILTSIGQSLESQYLVCLSASDKHGHEILVARIPDERAARGVHSSLLLCNKKMLYGTHFNLALMGHFDDLFAKSLWVVHLCER